MSRGASPTAIGTFVIGSLVLVIVGILVFGSGRLFTRTTEWVVFFEGSVNGLNPGSPVKFRGVRIGQVRWIRAYAVPETGDIQIAVLVEFEDGRVDTLREPEEGTYETELEQAWYQSDAAAEAEVVNFLVNERGMRAQLEVESLVTGQLFVNLDFFPDTAIRYQGLLPELNELPSVPSEMQQIRIALVETMKEIQKFPIEELGQNVLEAVAAANRLINSDEVERALKEAELTLVEARLLVRKLSDQVDPVSGDLRSALAQAESTLVQAETTLADASRTLVSVEGAVGEDSDVRFTLVQALRDLAAAARAIRTLSESLERNPNALIFGRQPPGEQ